MVGSSRPWLAKTSRSTRLTLRVRLISELHFDLDIEEDTMAMVLSLLDQLYAVRRSFSAVMSAVAAQPDDVRSSIATLVASKRGAFVELHE